MIHPSELLRTNSENEEQSAQFSAPIDSVNFSMDCGWHIFPCLNRSGRLERFADVTFFIIVLSIVGFLDGILLSYFRITSESWGGHYSISSDTIGWLIYINEIIIGVFALGIGYWGNRIHRTLWIGLITMMLSIICVVLIIPETLRTCKNKQDGYDFCSSKITDVNIVRQVSAYILISIFQLFMAIAKISFITHGFTYIDDNLAPTKCPSSIGLTLAACEFGKQIGMYISWIKSNGEYIFLTPNWLTSAGIAFGAGLILTMFPKKLNVKATRDLCASLVDLARGRSVMVHREFYDSFFISFKRLCKNRILMLNIAFVTLVQSAVINFDIFKQFYYGVKFRIPEGKLFDDTEPQKIQLFAKLIQTPLIIICIVSSGYIVAKAQPKSRSVVLFNVIAVFCITMLFGSSYILPCDSREFKLETSCKIDNSHKFDPICIKNTTYYSPGTAGCDYSTMMWKGCKCEKGTPKMGACNPCSVALIVFEVNSVASAALLAATLLPTIMIILRCVIVKRDKAVAVGLYATFIKLFPYVVFRIIYESLLDNFCVVKKDNRCYYYNDKMPYVLMGVTILNLLLSIIFGVLLYYYIKDLELFSESENDCINLDNLKRNDSDNPVSFKNGVSVPLLTTHDTIEPSALLKMSDSSLNNSIENLGDDHDSEDISGSEL